MATKRTHRAVVTVAKHAPVEVISVETVSPAKGEVLVKVEWVGSSPFDLHQNDGGLLVKHPEVLGGDAIAGSVVEVGPEVKNLAVGDQVFGFGFREQKEKAYQEYVTYAEYLLGKIPAGIKPQEAVTLPSNFVTVFHTLTKDLDLPLPWPRPDNYVPEDANAPFLIWGGSSSVGMFALPVLRYYGYTNLLAVASKKHHDLLKSLGATQAFDYRDADVTEQILAAASKIASAEPSNPFIIDCIGSKDGSLVPLARVAQKGAKVAVLLPVVVKDSTETSDPEYAMDPQAEAEWADGAVVRGVRTHFYLENEFLKDHLQSTIMPTMLARGDVRPLRQRVVEGDTLRARAQEAIDLLRRKEVSGERLVWRIPDA